MIARPAGLSRAVPALYSLALAALILGPLLGPGYLLLRDAVSTPRSFLTDSALGLTDAAARAVPQDAAIAALTSLLDGGLVVKAILLAALWLAGWGAARMVAALLPTTGLGPQLLASTVMLWNPYVAERLLQGHWSLLTGYAALPWAVLAALRLRRSARPWSPGSWCPLGLTLAAAGLTPTGALLATTLAAVLLAAPGGAGSRWPRLAVAAALAASASAPWLTATALSGAGAQGSDPTGVAAFAARAEPGLGTLGSLAGLGGIWNSAAVPATRTGLFAVAGTVVLLAVVACGLPALWRRRGNPVIAALAVVAAAAVLLPALAATGWGMTAGEWAVTRVPGAGLLRDAQKWVALAAPFYALAAAAGAGTLGRLGVRTSAGRVRSGQAAAVGIVAVLLALPDLAWGVGGALRPVHYPPAWERVAWQLRAADESGDVAVLPAGMFRLFPYSGDAPVLDPAPRMLPEDVLQTGELIVAAGTVEGEGGRARDVERLLLAGEDADGLARLGVRWVLVEHGTPGPLGQSRRTLDRLDEVYSDEELSLHRVAGDVAATGAEAGRRAASVVAHLVWAALLAGSASVLLAHHVRTGRGRGRADQA
ncbi:hypothetical protein [Rhodococcus daqingensis]|uniref:Transmembrane protein n=1 Tax=Rhodococcus daqingensis TaxID=2479363 RepID=A0ABW2RS51_9NOCA